VLQLDKGALMVGKKVKNYPNYVVFPTGKVLNIIRGTYLKPYKMNPTSGFYVGLSKNGLSKNVPLHKLVASHFGRMSRYDETAFHINYVKVDNRALNLKGCSIGDAAARTKRYNNTRRLRGIHKWNGKNIKWRAVLCVGKMKVQTIGYFKTRKEAYNAYVKAYTEHYNERPVNQ
jgi:hypothetical protein